MNKKTVKAYLQQWINISDNEILKIKKNHFGYTNDVYLVILKNNNHLKLRVAKDNKFIDRKLEYEIEKQFEQNFYYYDSSSGNYIKKWYDGHTLETSDLNDDFWKWIIDSISKLQNLKINKNEIKLVKYYDDLSIFEEPYLSIMKKYQSIVDQFDRNNFVLCHNDCSCNNIIVSDKNYHLLDFEWASLNHQLWDICNLIKDLDLTYEQVLNLNFINKHNYKQYLTIIFCTYAYTYIWTTRVKMTHKIKKYQNFIRQKLKYWFGVYEKEINK